MITEKEKFPPEGPESHPEVQCLTVGPIQACCYLVGRADRDDRVIIDPGGEPERILRALGDKKPAAVLLTHGHFDHIGAVDALRKVCPRILIHELDLPLLTDPELNASAGIWVRPLRVSAPAETVREGQELSPAGLRIQVLHTPGHTPGSVCYRIGDCLFTGDTLFTHGWGRTDLPGGNDGQMIASLRRLIPLSRSLRVFPGHED